MLTNPDEPGVEDEDMLNRRLVIVRFNTELLKSFDTQALATALGLSEETIKKNLKEGFPMEDDTVSRLRRCIIVDERGRISLKPLEPTSPEQAFNTRMLKRLNIVRTSISTTGMRAPIRAVVNEVSNAVTIGLTATFKGKQIEFKSAEIERIKEFLGEAIPAILGGTVLPRTKFACAIEQAISKASGAVEAAEKLGGCPEEC